MRVTIQVIRCMLLLSIFGNVSCSLFGPSYHKPKVDVSSKWPNKSSSEIDSRVNLPDMLWWKQFESPELNDLIKKALCHNNELNIAIANIDYAKAQLLQMKLNWLPGLSLLSGYSQFPIYGNPGKFYILYPVYAVNIFQLYKQQKSAEASVSVACHAKDTARLMVISQVSASYFTLIAQQEYLKLYENLLHNTVNYSLLNQSLYKNGLIPKDKVLEVESDVLLIKSKIADTKHNIIVSKNALHYLLNENPGEINVNTSFNELNTDKVIPVNLPVTVLKNRPDIRQAESELLTANENIGVATTTLLPSLDFSSYLGQGSNVNRIGLNNDVLSIPILEFPVIAKIKGSKAKYKVKYINYINTIRGALQEVDNELSAYKSFSSQLSNSTKALSFEKSHCDLVHQREKFGINNEVDKVICQIKIDNLQLSLNKNKLEKMMSIVRLYQDLAGGYNES